MNSENISTQVEFEIDGTRLLGYRYSTIVNELCSNASVLAYTKHYSAITKAIATKLSKKIPTINNIVSDISVLGLIPSMIEHSDTATLVNIILPLKNISETHIKYKSFVIDMDKIIDGLFDNIDDIEPVKYLFMIGMGGFNSNLIYNIYTLIGLYFSIKDAYDKGDIDKINRILGQVLINNENDVDIVLDNVKFDEFIANRLDQIFKMGKFLLTLFKDTVLYVWEPDTVEFSNTLRFPYMDYNNIGQPKIVYFKELLKILRDSGIFKDVKVSIGKFTDKHFKMVENMLSSNKGFITGAVSPKFRLKLTKTFNDRFIFLGHFDNNYTVTNDHRNIINLSEDDIFVSESYGNINLGTFMCNMYSATFDFLRILKLNTPMTFDRFFKDIVNTKTTFLLEHTLDHIDMYIPESNTYMHDVDDIIRNEKNLFHKEYISVFKDKAKIVDDNTYREIVDNNTAGLNREVVKYVISNPILMRQIDGIVTAMMIGYTI